MIQDRRLSPCSLTADLVIWPWLAAGLRSQRCLKRLHDPPSLTRPQGWLRGLDYGNYA